MSKFKVILAICLLLILMEFTLRFTYGTHLDYQLDWDNYWLFEPNQTGLYSFNAPPVTINSMGLRGPEFNLSKKTVLLIGDSFAFGWGLRDEQTLTYKLQNLLGEDCQVVNTAIPGHGPFQMNLQYRNHKYLEPEYTIVLFGKHDLNRLPIENQLDKRGYFYKTRIQGIFGHSQFIHWAADKTAHALRKQHGFASFYQNQNLSTEKLWQAQKKYFLNIYELADEPVFLIPYPDEELRSIVDMENIDMWDVYQKIPEDARYVSKKDGHPSELCNDLLAYSIYSEIINPSEP